jgi:Na+-driven multidrug efflux pump
VGQSLGAAKPKKAREAAFILTTIKATIVYPLKRSIASVFTSDLNILDETQQFLHIVLPSLPFFGICINIMSIGRGSGHTTFPTAIEIIRIWTIRIALGYFLAFIVGIGPMGIWLPARAMIGFNKALWTCNLKLRVNPYALYMLIVFPMYCWYGCFSFEGILCPLAKLC